MKAFLTLILLGCTTLYGQFRTTYNSNGDPLTDIVDESGMRQGTWLYYDHTDKLIRKEVYDQNKLKSRVHFVDQQTLETTHFQVEQLTVPAQHQTKLQKLRKEASGEILLDGESKVVTITLYHINNPKHLAECIQLAQELVTTLEEQKANAVLTF